MEVAYHIRLTAILDVTRFLLKQGLAFRGHDESSSSLNKGNFLELLEWYSLRNEEVWRTVNQNAPGNNQMTSPKVQKELANACAAEITRVIVDDIGDNYFSLLIDEARDISVKEQIGVILRYVNKDGYVIERFLAMVHVPDTLRHFFEESIVNVTGASCKRKDQLRQHHHDRLVEQLEKEKIVSGRGKNQESSLARPGDTRWGSHYTTILRLISMWTSVLEVLQNVHDDGASNDNRGITNELSLALQQKDQNIVQAMRLIEAVKARLQGLRETGWEEFMEEKLLRLAELYPEDFSMTECMMLEDQLATFIYDVQHDEDFTNIRDLGDFARKMVETEKRFIFPLVYRLIELTLVLPVVTANVERVFSQ
ncbi:uncharacterized protein LOC120265223 [Dioscorea cayenensis subsp. rotundata]|uniref:Uncharacterized protein LOC120265223 n=1 Tax=Dioscorea cayennensis subsp. rotundata TaxID=55577 RepID=A0AB40BPH2_DIOCR|nr:uncharacterized protein LOC120265223 [Dioscorea cayenensis subsp. rotundata]